MQRFDFSWSKDKYKLTNLFSFSQTAKISNKKKLIKKFFFKFI